MINGFLIILIHIKMDWTKEKIQNYYKLAKESFYETIEAYENDSAFQDDKLPKEVDILDIHTEPHSFGVMYDYPMFPPPVIYITLKLDSNKINMQGKYFLYLDKNGKYLDDWYDLNIINNYITE